MEGQEDVIVQVRIVGNVTGNEYSFMELSKETLLKDPALYLGYAHLAIPHSGGGGGEEFDPADTAIIVQARTRSADTVIGGDAEGVYGDWEGTFEFRPGATVLIPGEIIS